MTSLLELHGPTTALWVIEGTEGFKSLVFRDSASIPVLGDYDCLVKIEAVSLNYRDLLIPLGKYPYRFNLPRVPCCDGSGTIVLVGSHVSRFSPGDKVCTLFYQAYHGGPPTREVLATALGSALDGTLREYAVFAETGLVLAPSNLPSLAACTLPCAYLTAWNALFGQGARQMQPGDTVLVQGSGGVSLAALQFTVAAGGTAIATTSSPEKAMRMKHLGAHAVINYTEVSNWGEEARSLTPNGRGVDFVIEVGGPNTMQQSLEAVAMGGTIAVVGFLGGSRGSSSQPSLLDTLVHMCTVRGVVVGSKMQFEEMSRFIENKEIEPVIDEKVFDFTEAREAYKFMYDQRHFGKVVIRV